MAEHIWTVMVTYQISPEEAERADEARQRGELQAMDATSRGRSTISGPGCVLCRQEWIDCHDKPCPGGPTANRGADDPRETSGSGISSGDPSHGDVGIDIRNAILTDKVDGAVVGIDVGGQAQETGLAMSISGRLNKTPTRVTNLYLMKADAAAAIVSEIVALAVRVGPGFQRLIQDRLDQLKEKQLESGDGSNKSDA